MTTEGQPRGRQSKLPLALISTLALACVLTAGAWGIVVMHLATPQHKVLVVGDSYMIAHRVRPSGRLEAWLERDLAPDWVVRDFGESNAHSGDHYLEYSKARLVGFDPEVVVIGLSPHKLIPDDEQQWRRFRNHETNLKWLPWNAEGYRFFQTFTHPEKVSALVHAAGLLVGVYDALDAWFSTHVTQPRVLERFLHGSPAERQRVVAEHAAIVARHWQKVQVGSYADMARNQESRDLAFFVEALRAHHARAVALILPAGNPPMVERHLSPEAQAKLETTYAYTLEFCRQINLPVIDFNTSERRNLFRPDDWDDMFHLKTARAYGLMASGVAAWIRDPVSHARAQTASAQRPSGPRY